MGGVADFPRFPAATKQNGIRRESIPHEEPRPGVRKGSSFSAPLPWRSPNPAPPPPEFLPSCSSMESSLFRPALSSLLADDPDLGPRSTRRGSRGGGNEAPLSMGRSRPANLVVPQPPWVTFPSGISFRSPHPLFSPDQGPYGISNQQSQEQITSQDSQPHSYAHNPTVYPSPTSSMNLVSVQQMPYRPRSTYNPTSESAHGDNKAQSSTLIADKPADDGYNWRKYGQKPVKGGEYLRSYYKCTHPKCPVKKTVERPFDGQVTEIIYNGQHNHQLRQLNRHRKEGELSPGTASQGLCGNFSRSGEATYKRDRESNCGSPEHLSDSSDGEEADETALWSSDEPPSRKNMDLRNIGLASYRMVTEPKVIVQTTSEVDLLDDGYRWRKYGQKLVKGHLHPRSYYKCTYMGCIVRKQVERASADPKAVITTYEGKHNHNAPGATTQQHGDEGRCLAPL